jgi:hypothetical protein
MDSDMPLPWDTQPTFKVLSRMENLWWRMDGSIFVMAIGVMPSAKLHQSIGCLTLNLVESLEAQVNDGRIRSVEEVFLFTESI